jgi:hypothetical protein
MSYGGLNKKHTFFIYDVGGLFSQFAISLSNEGHEVYYFTPFYESVTFKRYAIGLNMGNVKKPLYFFQKLLKFKKEDVTIMFPDVGAGDLAHFLKQMGYSVFAAGFGDIMEFHREWVKKKLKELGLPVMKYVLVEGIENLKKYLEKNPDKIIKLDIFRGDAETWHAQDANSVDMKLKKLEKSFGPFAYDYNFIVEEKIEGDEPGFDMIFNKTDYVKPYLWGWEIKKGPYCGVCSLEVPKVIAQIRDGLKPLLQKLDWRGFISTEMKVKDGKPYLIDICCYDDKTEILTDKGWKLFKDLGRKDKVATLNPLTKKIEYQKPTNYFVYDYDGEMISIKSTAIDLLVTPNHQMYIKKQQKKDYEFVRADKIPQGAIIPRTGIWEGREKKYFILPPYKKTWISGRGLKIKKTINLPALKIPMDMWLKFLGLFLAEGSLSYGSVNISQKNYTDKVWEYIKDLPFKIRKEKWGFRICSIQLSEYLKKFGKCHQKFVPNYVKKLSPRQIEIFLDAYCLGDGYIRKSGGRRFYTTSKKMADDIQELIFKIGRVANIRIKKTKNTPMRIGDKSYIRNYDIFVVEERIKRKEFYIDKSRFNHIKKVNYRGKIYCVEVPNHIVYVRRNGKPVWSGNSRAPHPLGLGFPLLYENFAEIIYKVARGIPVEAKIRGKFFVVLPVGNSVANEEWVHLIFPEKAQNGIKIGDCYFAIYPTAGAGSLKYQKGYYHVPNVTEYTFVIVGVGNDLKKIKKGISYLQKKVDIGGEGIEEMPEADLNEAFSHIQRVIKEQKIKV